MELIHAVIYGIVEGVTEFLPISSTGHLMIVSELLGNNSEFIKSFEIMIQLGAILAIVALYPKRLLTDQKTIIRIFAAFIPTAILGLISYQFIKTYLLGNVAIVFVALFVGGLAILYLERMWKKSPATTPTLLLNELPLHRAALLGVMQCVAFVPGVSRSAMTIFGGMFLGLSRKEAVEFSFFLAVPTMGAATLLDVVKNYQTFTSDNVTFLLVGFVTSFIVAILVARWLAHYIATNDFTWFGYYRIAIAVVGYFVFFY